MPRPITWPLAGAALALLAAGCTRAADDELLEGKACESDSDCIGSYRCDSAASLCVRGLAAPGEGGDTGSAGAGGSSATGGTSGGGAGGSDSGGAGGSAPDDSTDPGGAGGNGAGSACDESCGGDHACLGDRCVARWLPLAAPPAELGARSKPAFAVGNGKLFVWGGADATGADSNAGAIYDLAQDRWELVPISETTPTPRTLANAAWTGTSFLVWGGRLNSGASEYRNGAVYDPATGVWTTLPAAGSARSASIMLSYGGEVLSWGGWSRTGVVLNRSQRYSANQSKWFGATADALDKREHLGWTTLGARLYMLGGRSDTGEPLADVLVYDIGTLGWSSLQSLPLGRYGSFSAHDGSGLFTWGGRDLEAAHADGLVMEGSLWTPVASDGAPSARWAPHRQSGWACALSGERVAVSGGQDVNGLPLRDGAVYSRGSDAWTPLPASSETHEWGVGACIDGTLVLWGGTHDGTASDRGEKLTP